MKKRWWMIIISGIIIVAIILGFLGYRYFKINSNHETPINSNNQSQSLRTYKNDDFGFQIKYPNNFLSSEPIATAVTCPGTCKEYAKLGLATYSPNVIAACIETNNTSGYTTDAYTINKENKCFTLILTYKTCDSLDANCSNELELIRASFRFNELTSAEQQCINAGGEMKPINDRTIICECPNGKQYNGTNC